jgi:hypothetical protein
MGLLLDGRAEGLRNPNELEAKYVQGAEKPTPIFIAPHALHMYSTARPALVLATRWVSLFFGVHAYFPEDESAKKTK